MNRTPLVLAVSVGLLALGTLGWWWERALPTVRTVEIRTTTPPDAASVTDCPHSVDCVTVPARPAVLAAVRAAFPSGQLIDSWRLQGADGTGYSENVRLAATGAVVSVNARCVPGATSLADRSIGARASTGPALVSVVVAGRVGCSVAVTLRVTPGVTVPWTASTELAHESVLQIPG